MRRATSTALSAAKNCCMSSRRVERGREGGSMRALFLGNVAADTANGIRAELPPELEIEIVADPKELTPKAAAATDILVTNIWRTDYPPAPRIALVQSVATGIEWIEQAALPRGVAICTAFGPETERLFDARRLARMKPTAFLVNIARSAIIDEDALYATLRDGTIGGAAIDVWWQYPNAAEPDRRGSRHPFHELPNIIMTPHCSGWTAGMVRRRWDEIAENLRRFVRGENLINVVTTT